MDKTFGKTITWDIPLLTGYAYTFVENVSKKPGSHHFFGIDCPELITQIENYSPDAILVFGWNFKSHLKVLRFFKGRIPVWFRGDSTLLDESTGLKTVLRRVFLTWVYRHIDKALFVGEANKAYLLKHGLKEQQLIHAPHAIDNSRFIGNETHEYRDKAIEWRTELGYTSEDLVVLFVGKFEPKKQPDFLLDALILANKLRNHPLKLIFAGNGPMEDALRIKASKLEHVTFLPFQNQSVMPIVYRLGDVFCLPSQGPGETWGLAVNEAMASGKPVIVSDKVGCSYDVVVHKNTGYRFNHNSQEELIAILANLNKAELKDRGESAKVIIKDFNFLKIVKAIETNL